MGGTTASKSAAVLVSFAGGIVDFVCPSYFFCSSVFLFFVFVFLLQKNQVIIALLRPGEN